MAERPARPVTLAALIAAVMADHGFADFAVEDVHALLGGYRRRRACCRRERRWSRCCEVFASNAADAGDRVLFRGLRTAARRRARSGQRWSSAQTSRWSRGGARRRRSSPPSWCCASSTRQGLPDRRRRLRAGSPAKAGGRRTIELSAVLELSRSGAADRRAASRHLGRARTHRPRAAAERARHRCGRLLTLPDGGAVGDAARRADRGWRERRSLALRRDRRSRPAAPRATVREPPETIVPFGKPAVRIVELRAAGWRAGARAAARGVRRSLAGHDRGLLAPPRAEVFA